MAQSPVHFLKRLYSQNSLRGLKKQVITLRNDLESMRPVAELASMATQQEGILIQFQPLPDDTLYGIALHSDVIQTIIKTLRSEVFRNGWEFEKAFEWRCKDCGQEYDYEPEARKCENCGSTNLYEPDYDQIKSAENDFTNTVNLNGQSFIEVMKELEDDVNTYDNAYLLLVKKYNYNTEGSMLTAEISEIIRGNALSMKIVANEQGIPAINENGREMRTCTEHRSQFWMDTDHCPVCNKQLFPIHFVSIDGDKKTYYLKGEVLHFSRHNPSITYGFSPIFSVWQKTMTLWHMDRYNLQAYQKQRPPKGILLVNTRNFESLKKSWEWLLSKVSRNPHMIWPLGVESNSQRGQVAQFVKFMDSLSEMQFTEAQQDMVRRIGAVYGVEPLFQGDISASGGLNNESLQITVTNRTIENIQALYNDKVFPFITKQLGITDWKLVLNPSEEQDETAEEQLSLLKSQRAEIMLNMGFCVELDEYGDFQYSGKAEKRVESTPFGALGQPRGFSGEPLKPPSRIMQGRPIKKISDDVYQVS